MADSQAGTGWLSGDVLGDGIKIRFPAWGLHSLSFIEPMSKEQPWSPCGPPLRLHFLSIHAQLVQRRLRRQIHRRVRAG